MEKLLLTASLSLFAILAFQASADTTIPLSPVHLTSEQATQRHEFRLKHSPYYRRVHEQRVNARQFREQREQSAKAALPTGTGRWNRVKADAGSSSINASSLNSTIVAEVLNYLQSLDLLANVTVGTPGNEILTMFDFLSNDFYFIDTNVKSAASLFGSTQDSTVGDRYSPSDSSTSSVSKTFFYAEFGNIDGTVAEDLVTFVGYDNMTVALNATFGDGTVAVVVPTDYNGVIGLLPTSSFSNNMDTDALTQMADQLEDPVLTYYLNLNTPPAAALSVGHLDTEHCKDPTTFYTRSSSSANTSFSFGVNSVSTTVSTETCNDDGQSCTVTSYTYAVETAKQVEVVPFLPAILTSTEVLNIFVTASGAVYNNDTTLYLMSDCDAAVKSARDVTLMGVDGQSLVLTPLDYVTEVAYDEYTICALAVFDYYSEADNTNNASTLFLHQGFINNHCVSYKLDEAQLGLADSKQPALWTLELDIGSDARDSE